MDKKRILIVDDEIAISDAIKYYLEREGHIADTAKVGSEALHMLNNTAFDLIVLDLMLPDINGLEITRMLKKKSTTAKIPIILLTAKSDEIDMVIGHELDVADYIIKPFSARILIARINSILRQQELRIMVEPQKAGYFRIKELEIHIKAHEVYVRGQKTNLTKTEFELLLLLIQHPGWVYSRTRIVEELNGGDYFVTDRSVDSQIKNLRKKLGYCANYIETIRGVGYKFSETD